MAPGLISPRNLEPMQRSAPARSASIIGDALAEVVRAVGVPHHQILAKCAAFESSAQGGAISLLAYVHEVRAQSESP